MDSSEEILGGPLVSAALPHKVSCVRWVPEQLVQPETFLTSSWDSVQNSITLWSQFHDSLDAVDFPPDAEVLATKYLAGDIIGFEFLDDQTIACATSEGDLRILSITRDTIAEKFALPNLHHWKGSKVACTGLSVYDHSVATIGEDGCLNIVSGALGKVVRSIKDNSPALCSVCFVKANTLLTSSRAGNIDCYDMRDPSDEPVFTLSTRIEDEDELTDTTCIAYQPLQSEIVFAGLEDGSVMGWDLREPDLYSTHFTPHDSRVNALTFRKHDPKMLFTGTESGEVYQWQMQPDYAYVEEFVQMVRAYGPVVENHYAINTIDVSESHMICSGDDAFVFVLELPEN